MSTDPEILRRLALIEQQLVRLSQHAGIDYPSFPAAQLTADGGLPADVVALVRAGNKIGAIKRYRELTGCDLVTAKDAVERI